MRVAIYGAGAVGVYFGAKLSPQGHEVVFIARGAQLETLRSAGLSINGVEDSFTLSDLWVTDDPATIGPVDTVLLAVKSWQVDATLPHLAGLLHEDGRVLTLQNGVETPDLVADYVGAERVLAGLVRGFFFNEGPGRVRHLGVQPSIIFGPISGGVDLQAQKLCAALLATGAYAEIPTDIHAALWEKFMLVTALGGVGAVTRMAIGPLRDYAPTREMLREAMQEIDTLARARGVRLPSDTVDVVMAFIDTFPPDATASMQRDIMEGRPSELEAQCGAVVRLAAASGVDVPLNAWIYHSLILLERAARGA